jgi:transcription elongation factor GreB
MRKRRLHTRDAAERRRDGRIAVDEADPAAGLVAFVAPVARALLGHRVGDVVTVRAPGGEDRLEILRAE